MSNLQEVPTDDLLSFQDYSTVPVHNTINSSTVSVPVSQIDVSGNLKSGPAEVSGNMQQQTHTSSQLPNAPIEAGGDAGMTSSSIVG